LKREREREDWKEKCNFLSHPSKQRPICDGDDDDGDGEQRKISLIARQTKWDGCVG